jgi:hypothetical protein
MLAALCVLDLIIAFIMHSRKRRRRNVTDATFYVKGLTSPYLKVLEGVKTLVAVKIPEHCDMT